MTVPVKLAGFTAVLVLAAGTAFGMGRLSGVDGAAVTEEADSPAHVEPGAAAIHDHTGRADHADHDTSPETLPGGLQVVDDGYTMVVLRQPTTTGRAEPFEFRIVGPDGTPVTEFVETHEADLHLIVARRDLTGYQHVHPELDVDGTWTVPLRIDEAGTYRVFADVRPEGRSDALTLGVDVHVPGSFTPHPVDPPAPVAVDGEYTVSLDGDLRAGQTSRLTLTVSRNGTPVTDLQPYLGAAGHLVALRHGDLAYVHVHPEGSTGMGPEVGFEVGAPSVGTYRLFFEFRHDDAVRTVEFTLEADREH